MAKTFNELTKFQLKLTELLKVLVLFLEVRFNLRRYPWYCLQNGTNYRQLLQARERETHTQFLDLPLLVAITSHS